MSTTLYHPSLGALALLLLAPLAAPAAHAEGKTIVYEGKLQDAHRKPIGGVFPLSFSLHKQPKGGRSQWSESHFVAIDGGKYVVELGLKHPLPPKLDLDRAFLGVSITGGAEIVRERIQPGSVKKDKPERPPPPAPPGDPIAADGKGKKVVDYAETAGLAYQSEHAKVADAIGGLDEEMLLEKLKNAGSGANIGSTKRYTSSAGGEGGVAYELKCPKGFVVTGLRGGSGIYIDSVQLICSPLE